MIRSLGALPKESPDDRRTSRWFTPLPLLTFKRLVRSFGLLGRYGTPRKLRNLLEAEAAFLRHDVTVRSLPYLYRVDPTNQCPLGCPYCWRSISRPVTPAALSLATFIEGFAPFEETCLMAAFQMFGEPTLNDALPDMINYAHRKKVATYISTNLNHVDTDYISRLLSSGLDLLTISLDAATAETYRIMKPKGDYDRLINNTLRTFELKRSMRHAPAVGFQVLVTRHNENQLQPIARFAQRLGADYLDFKPVVFLPDHSWVPANRKYHISRYERSKPNCSMPWTNITLLANGRYFPCCAFPDHFDLGPIAGNAYEEIWNGNTLKAIREGFRTGSLFPFCRNCPLARMPRF